MLLFFFFLKIKGLGIVSVMIFCNLLPDLKLRLYSQSPVLIPLKPMPSLASSSLGTESIHQSSFSCFITLGWNQNIFFFVSKRHDDVWCCLLFDCSGPSCREVHLNWLLCWIFTSSFRHDDFLQDSFRPCKRQDSSLHFQSTISCLAQRHSLHTLKSVTKTPAWRSDCVVNFCLSFLSVVSLCRHLVGFNDRACHFYSITTIYACIKAVWVRAASE